MINIYSIINRIIKNRWSLKFYDKNNNVIIRAYTPVILMIIPADNPDDIDDNESLDNSSNLSPSNGRANSKMMMKINQNESSKQDHLNEYLQKLANEKKRRLSIKQKCSWTLYEEICKT